MKIRLAVREERYEELRKELEEKGIEIDEASDLVLSETGKYPDYLSVREADAEGRRRHIPTEDILYIESLGHTVEVHGKAKTYETTERIYQLQNLLDPKIFLRISNSVIVNRSKIRHITPTFSQKFILTMEDGSRVDVTRSYYYEFKKAIGI